MLREGLEKPWMPTGACPRALDPGVGMTKTVGRRVTVNAGWYETHGILFWWNILEHMAKSCNCRVAGCSGNE
jgi:hypothetical protein